MEQSKDSFPAEAEKYMMPSHFVESDSLEVRAFVSAALRDLPPDASARDKAIHLFEAVRDGIRYDPYCFALDEDSYRASRIAGAGLSLSQRPNERKRNKGMGSTTAAHRRRLCGHHTWQPSHLGLSAYAVRF